MEIQKKEGEKKTKDLVEMQRITERATDEAERSQAELQKLKATLREKESDEGRRHDQERVLMDLESKYKKSQSSVASLEQRLQDQVERAALTEREHLNVRHEMEEIIRQLEYQSTSQARELEVLL